MQLIDGGLKLAKHCAFVNTGMVLGAAVSFYALGKNQFSKFGKHQFIDVALQQMYGSGDSPSKFTTHVIHGCLRSLAVFRRSAGTQKRDIVYIDNVLGDYGTLVKRAPELSIFE